MTLKYPYEIMHMTRPEYENHLKQYAAEKVREVLESVKISKFIPHPFSKEIREKSSQEQLLMALKSQESFIQQEISRYQQGEELTKEEDGE